MSMERDHEAEFRVVFSHLGAVIAYARRRGSRDAEALGADVMTVAWRRLSDVPKDDPRPWQSWRVRVFEAQNGTEQASTTLPRSDLNVPCGAVRQFCRSFGAADGWVLSPDKEYFVTIAAVLDAGGELVSAPSTNSRPRTTELPDPVPVEQVSGCGCGTALSSTGARPAFRGDGVNTATGAFSRLEPDLSMASFGVSFASNRVYFAARSYVRTILGCVPSPLSEVDSSSLSRRRSG